MKLNKETYDPKLHKVTLKGKPVKIAGFGIDEYDNYAFYLNEANNLGCSNIENFEVSEVKRFRVGLFTFGLCVVTDMTHDYTKDTNFIKWLIDWTEYV